MDFILGIGVGFVIAGLYVIWHEKIAKKRGTVVLLGKEYYIVEVTK